MSTAPPLSNRPRSLRDQVRLAVLWRSGSQVVAQVLQWLATFAVIRLLDPADYGLFAMTQVVLVFMSLLSGASLASGLVQRATVTRQEVGQLFGLLLTVNLCLAAIQFALAPLIAGFYRQPEIAALLRAQSLLYLLTPFVAIPQALLARGLEYRSQAKTNVVASLAAAGTALAGALAGWGVWTLVAAPIVLFAVRGAGLMLAAGGLPRPRLDLSGMGGFVRFGGLVAASQLFALLWSQADILIGGRTLSPHLLGLYSTSLFLVQVFVSKFVPPLNEVAFSVYARLQDDRVALASAFLKMARVVMVAAMPFYLGLAATAEPLVLVVLGGQWGGAAPIVRVLALSMPFYTIYVLFGPASDAIGRPGIATRNGAVAAVLAPALLLFTVRWGVLGMAATWLLVFPVLLVVAGRRTLPAIGVAPRALAGVVAPAVLAALAMATVVVAVDRAVPAMVPAQRLALLVATGGLVYGGWLLLFAREAVRELVDLLRRRS